MCATSGQRHSGRQHPGGYADRQDAASLGGADASTAAGALPLVLCEPCWTMVWGLWYVRGGSGGVQGFRVPQGKCVVRTRIETRCCRACLEQALQGHRCYKLGRRIIVNQSLDSCRCATAQNGESLNTHPKQGAGRRSVAFIPKRNHICVLMIFTSWLDECETLLVPQLGLMLWRTIEALPMDGQSSWCRGL